MTTLYANIPSHKWNCESQILDYLIAKDETEPLVLVCKNNLASLGKLDIPWPANEEGTYGIKRMDKFPKMV